MPIVDRLARVARGRPASRTKQRAGRLAAMAATRLGASPDCLVEIGGAVLELDANDRTQAEAVWNGTYELGSVEALGRLSAVFGGVGYDLGANVGLIALPWLTAIRRANPSSQVIAVEPFPENARALQRNIALNDLDVRVFEIALGDEEGVVTMARESRFRASTGNAVLDGPGQSLPGYNATRSVPITRLDRLQRTERLPLPDVVKIDVEGAESALLAGARATFVQARPVIIGEFNSALMPRFGTTFLDAYRELPPDCAVFSFVAGLRLCERPPEVGLGDVLLAPRECIDALPFELVG